MRFKIQRVEGFLAMLLSATATLSPGGLAVAAGEPDSQANGAGLEEIVVTAQRRSENLQSVPISVQVISRDALAERNFDSIESLTQVVPDVHVGPAGATSDMYIRGVGSGANTSFDQSVGLFVDDIYHGRSRVTQSTFLDLDHLEILKGPQSTFFGNNAIAGALNIVTKKPGDVLEADARALYGQFGQYAVEGGIGGPLTDQLSVRVAAIVNGQRGWIENINSGGHVPDTIDEAGRITLLYKPTQDFDATFKVEASDHHEEGTAYSGLPLQGVNCPPPPPFPVNFAEPGCGNYLATPGLPLGFNNNQNADDPGQNNYLSSFEGVLTLNYRQWSHTFTSVSGFYNYHFNLNLDNSGTLPVLLTTQAPEKYHQFSQEFRVASPDHQTFEYLAGVYLQTDNLVSNLENNYQFADPFFPPGSPLTGLLPLARNIGFSQGEHSYAIFGALTWNINDQLKLTAGLRGSKVNKSYVQDFQYGTGEQNYGGFVPLPAALVPPAGFFGQGVPGVLSGERSDHAWLPSAKLQYSITPQAMVYASYAKGFKAGGFNGDDPTGSASSVPFSPEHVNAYEVGLKSEWLDHRALLNVAVFRSDYSDLQVSIDEIQVQGAQVLLVRNAASSRSEGVELEAQFAFTPEFRLSTNLTYLESYYVSYPNAGPTALQTFQGVPAQDLTGSPTEFAPRWTGSLNATYTVPLRAGYRFTTELSPYFSARYYLHDSDDPLLAQGPYARLDGRLTLDNPDRHWGVDVIAKNLTDRVINSALGGLYLASKQEPRNFAIQFRYRY